MTTIHTTNFFHDYKHCFSIWHTFPFSCLHMHGEITFKCTQHSRVRHIFQSAYTDVISLGSMRDVALWTKTE